MSTDPTLKVIQQMNQKNLEKPWLDATGALLADFELRQISKTWNEELWNRYLTATVDAEMSRSEITTRDYPNFLEEESETIWNSSGRVPEEICRQIKAALRKLTIAERDVVRGLYFHDFTESQLAAKLKISQQMVNKRKSLSLRKIKCLLENEVVAASYLIRGSKNLNPKNLSREEQILEVYTEDLKGSYLK